MLYRIYRWGQAVWNLEAYSLRSSLGRVFRWIRSHQALALAETITTDTDPSILASQVPSTSPITIFLRISFLESLNTNRYTIFLFFDAKWPLISKLWYKQDGREMHIVRQTIRTWKLKNLLQSSGLCNTHSLRILSALFKIYIFFTLILSSSSAAWRRGIFTPLILHTYQDSIYRFNFFGYVLNTALSIWNLMLSVKKQRWSVAKILFIWVSYTLSYL